MRRLLIWARRDPRRVFVVAGLALLVLVAVIFVPEILRYRAEQRREALEVSLAEAFARVLATDYDGAATAFREIADREPDEPEPVAGMVITLLRAGHADEALRQLDALRNAGRHVDVCQRLLAALARRAAESRRASGSAETTARGTATAPASGSAPDSRPVRLETAFDFWLEAQCVQISVSPSTASSRQRVFELIEQAAMRAPRRRLLYLCDRCQAAAEARQETVARSAIQALEELYPDTAAARFRCGVSARVLSDLAISERNLEAAVRLAPHDARMFNSLGNVLHDLGRDEEALARFEVALRLEPRSATFRYNLGNSYLALGRLPEAEEAYRTAFAGDPSFVDAVHHLGLVLLREGGRDGEAEAALRAYRERHPSARASMNHGIALQRLDRLSEAEQCFTDAARSEAFQAIATYQRAHCLRGLGRFEEAAIGFSEADRLSRAAGSPIADAASNGAIARQLADAMATADGARNDRRDPSVLCELAEALAQDGWSRHAFSLAEMAAALDTSGVAVLLRASGAAARVLVKQGAGSVADNSRAGARGVRVGDALDDSARAAAFVALTEWLELAAAASVGGDRALAVRWEALDPWQDALLALSASPLLELLPSAGRAEFDRAWIAVQTVAPVWRDAR